MSPDGGPISPLRWIALGVRAASLHPPRERQGIWQLVWELSDGDTETLTSQDYLKIDAEIVRLGGETGDAITERCFKRFDGGGQHAQ